MISMRGAKALRRKKFSKVGRRLRRGATVMRFRPMNERRQARINYRRRLKRDRTRARMPAAHDAHHAYPLRSEQQGSEVLAYIRKRN